MISYHTIEGILNRPPRKSPKVVTPKRSKKHEKQEAKVTNSVAELEPIQMSLKGNRLKVVIFSESIMNY
jgi:hypothetical protein